MTSRILFLILLTALSSSVNAEMEKKATLCDTTICFQWWPKLPEVKGWHQDMNQSLHDSVNAQAPDGRTFVNAETVIYAKASYKPRIPKTKTLQQLIDEDQAEFRAHGIAIRKLESVTTRDGQKLVSFGYSPVKQGNWEQVSYGEEGDFYLIFAVSSRTKLGLSRALGDYKKFIGAYKTNP